MKILLAWLLTSVLIVGAGAAEREKSRSQEQLHFSAEDNGVKNPVPVPEPVLAILAREEAVRNVLDNDNIPPKSVPASWFSASLTHLSGPNEQDLIVMGTGPLRGANVIPFWVFCVAANGYELVLASPAHDLIVKKTRWRGHRDIELISITAREISTVLCRFDGKKYKQYRSKLEHIP